MKTADMSMDLSDGGDRKPERPRLEHFYSTDTTIEAMAEMLSSSAGVALHRDELIGWVKSHDAYKGGRGGERQQHLSMWSGSSIKVDRKGKDSIIVQKPVVCVVGGIQPDVLGELAEEAGRKDGFLERFLFSCPVTGPMFWSEETIPEELTEKVVELFRGLRYEEDV